ncbi:MAG: hypothetical protein ABSB91_06570 [Sedimentisphaerales bacterium]
MGVQTLQIAQIDEYEQDRQDGVGMKFIFYSKSAKKVVQNARKMTKVSAF